MFLSFASWRRCGLLALMAFVMSACQANVTVAVAVSPDGSGTVLATTAFDQDVTVELLDLGADADGILLEDLAQSGWVITPPEPRDDGSTAIVAAKAFGTPAQFSEIMDELAGPDGVFRDFGLTRSKTFARVAYDIEGTIDTTGDIGTFGDAELETSLERTLQEIAAQYEVSEDQIDLGFEVVLPGSLQGDAPNGVVASEPDEVKAVWSVSLADDDVSVVSLGSATRDVPLLVLRGVAGLAAVLAFLVVLALVLRLVLPDARIPGRRAKPRPKRNAESTRAAPARGASSKPPPRTEVVGAGDDTPEAVAEHEANPYKVIAIDAMGVLFREADDVSTLLIPFIRERSFLAPSDEEIEARARSLSLGRLTTGQFWASVGVEGDVAELDTTYLAQHQLMPGVIRYLRSKRNRGMKVACVTNNASSWAQRLKTNHDLQGLIDPWVVSGSVGVRKPDKPIFEVLRRLTGEPPHRILVVDDDTTMLDAAHELGFATAWFAPEGIPADAGVHLHIRSFDSQVDEPTDGDTARAEAGAKPTD